MKLKPGPHHPHRLFIFLFFFSFFLFLFFQYFFWEYPGGAGGREGEGRPRAPQSQPKAPPSSKEPWGLSASESDHPHREPDGLGRGFLSLAKLAPCYSDLDPKSTVQIKSYSPKKLRSCLDTHTYSRYPVKNELLGLLPYNTLIS